MPLNKDMKELHQFSEMEYSVLCDWQFSYSSDLKKENG